MAAESRIAIESDADVVTARQRARELAGELELTEHGPDAARHRDLRGRAQHHDLRDARRGAAASRARRQRPPGHRGHRARPRARASRTSSGRCRTATRPAAGSGSGCRARAGWSTSSTSRPRRGRARRCTLVKWSRRRACVRDEPLARRRSTAAWRARRSRARTRSGDLAVFVAYERRRAGRPRSTGSATAPAAADAAEAAAERVRRARRRGARGAAAGAATRRCARRAAS